MIRTEQRWWDMLSDGVPVVYHKPTEEGERIAREFIRAIRDGALDEHVPPEPQEHDRI